MAAVFFVCVDLTIIVTVNRPIWNVIRIRTTSFRRNGATACAFVCSLPALSSSYIIQDSVLRFKANKKIVGGAYVRMIEDGAGVGERVNVVGHEAGPPLS